MAVPFPDSVVIAAWKRSGGKCECRLQKCGHGIPHNKGLLWDHRGKETSYGWEAHHVNRHGLPVLSNCQILCQPCHKETETYGN